MDKNRLNFREQCRATFPSPKVPSLYLTSTFKVSSAAKVGIKNPRSVGPAREQVCPNLPSSPNKADPSHTGEMEDVGLHVKHELSNQKQSFQSKSM